MLIYKPFLSFSGEFGKLQVYVYVYLGIWKSLYSSQQIMFSSSTMLGTVENSFNLFFLKHIDHI